MFDPRELASFAVSEFERGLAGIFEEESQRKFEKADGSEMNSAAWTVGHLAAHWEIAAALAAGTEFSTELYARHFGPTADPASPPLHEVLDRFRRWSSDLDEWIPLDDESMLRATPLPDNVSQVIMKLILHTWFHIGEINAVRQLLGHPEIEFLGDSMPPSWKPASVESNHREVSAPQLD